MLEQPSEDIVDFDLRPSWVNVADGAAAVVEDGSTPADPSRGSREVAVDDGFDDKDDERKTPRWLSVLQVLVLVLVGLALGPLVWQMATGNVLGDSTGPAGLSRSGLIVSAGGLPA